MKGAKKLLGVLMAGILMLSCSGQTIEEEAQKAAYLSKMSMEYSAKNKLNEAEGNYMEVQKIMDKYRYTDKFQHFMDLYNLYLQNYLEESEYTITEEIPNK